MGSSGRTSTPRQDPPVIRGTRIPGLGERTSQLRRRPPIGLVLGLLAASLVVAVVFGAAFGSVAITPLALVEMTVNHVGIGHFPVTWPSQDEAIFFELRLPRVVGGALVGLALATAGTLFQGLLRNPLADPYAIGTSGGASLGAVVAMLLTGSFRWLGFGLVPLAAFAGALAAMALIYRLARVAGRTPVVTLLLAGFAVSVILSYTVSLLLIVDDREQLNLPRVYAWLLGGVSVSEWSQLAVVGPLILLGAIGAAALARSLNALSLGEEMAERLGVDVERDKLIAIVVGSLLTAAAVTISGLVGFVGLVVPHVLRLLCGPDHRLLIPATALAGATFLVVADLIARTVLAPAELPVGIITAFLGGPYFLYLLRSARWEYTL
jgi:iron complex transport system permease protein